LAVPAIAGKVVEQPTHGIFGAKVGIMSRANIRGDLYLRTEIGSTAQVYADFPVWRRFYLATSFDFYYIELVRNNDVMIDGSLGVKYEFLLPRANMLLRPGIAIGYGFLPEINEIRATSWATVKTFMETHFTINPRRAFVCELAVMGAPVGGYGSLDLTLGPAFMLRVGLAFR